MPKPGEGERISILGGGVLQVMVVCKWVGRRKVEDREKVYRRRRRKEGETEG